jgi:GNAT superfamily N-acetyltransferase
METDIKTIEDLSLNAWPSHQIELYDGWILRFSYFYTHRTNCVEQIGSPVLPLKDKVAYCEQTYRRWGTPCIFKISPIGDPDTDACLSSRGYEIQHHTTVMTRSLEGENLVPSNQADLKQSALKDSSSNPVLQIEPRVYSDWIEGLFALKKTKDPIHRKIVPLMYAAIPKDEIAVSVRKNGKIAATGLGILDRDYVGVYAIHVSEELRRQGYASLMIETILNEAKRRGAGHAYLQVVTDNAPAHSLYRKLGFTDSYRYWFRVKEV